MGKLVSSGWGELVSSGGSWLVVGRKLVISGEEAG